MDRAITQHYLSYEFQGEHIRLPMVMVRLKGLPEKTVKTAALVDSGATATFVPPDFAEIVDLKLREPSDATGAGGKFATNLADLGIEVLKGGTVAADMDCEVHVPVERDRVPYVVLGRDSIFLRYDITFRENRGLFVLRRPRR